jgi:hypothetical protein
MAGLVDPIFSLRPYKLSTLLTMRLATEVDVVEDDGQVKIDSDSILGFLEVLYQRPYEVSLVPDQSE